MTQARLLIADADIPTRVGLRVALQAAGLDVVAEAEDAETAVAAAEGRHVDLALVSWELPGGGRETVRALSSLRPAPRVMVMAAQPNGDDLVAAVLAGATGYLSREMSPARLPNAAKGVLAGEVALPRRHSAHLVAALRAQSARRETVSARATAPLSDREWEVLELLAEGASTAAMAHRLDISEVTVRRHISTVVKKLGVADRHEAAALLGDRSAS